MTVDDHQKPSCIMVGGSQNHWKKRQTEWLSLTIPFNSNARVSNYFWCFEYSKLCKLCPTTITLSVEFGSTFISKCRFMIHYFTQRPYKNLSTLELWNLKCVDAQSALYANTFCRFFGMCVTTQQHDLGFVFQRWLIVFGCFWASSSGSWFCISNMLLKTVKGCFFSNCNWFPVLVQVVYIYSFTFNCI